MAARPRTPAKVANRGKGKTNGPPSRRKIRARKVKKLKFARVSSRSSTKGRAAAQQPTPANETPAPSIPVPEPEAWATRTAPPKPTKRTRAVWMYSKAFTARWRWSIRTAKLPM